MPNREFYRRHLPHWQPANATLFVTTRLAGSLPQEVIVRLKEQRPEIGKTSSDLFIAAQSNEKTYFERWDAALNQYNQNRQWLALPSIREIVRESLHYRDGKVYDLIAYSIMPNHLHILFTPLQKDGIPIPLTKIMQSLKRHTARQANQILGRQGAFWQAESYDHAVRNTKELERIIQYILYNPVKAGLARNWRNWAGNYCKTDYQTVLQE